MSQLPPTSTLFPYTTLFRSACNSRFTCSWVPHAHVGFRERRLQLPVHLDRKSTRLHSSHLGISYAVFCLKKKTLRALPPTNFQHHRHRTSRGFTNFYSVPLP